MHESPYRVSPKESQDAPQASVRKAFKKYMEPYQNDPEQVYQDFMNELDRYGVRILKYKMSADDQYSNYEIIGTLGRDSDQFVIGHTPLSPAEVSVHDSLYREKVDFFSDLYNKNYILNKNFKRISSKASVVQNLLDEVHQMGFAKVLKRVINKYTIEKIEKIFQEKINHLKVVQERIQKFSDEEGISKLSVSFFKRETISDDDFNKVKTDKIKEFEALQSEIDSIEKVFDELIENLQQDN